MYRALRDFQILGQIARKKGEPYGPKKLNFGAFTKKHSGKRE